jgi:lipopolysaccharide/colanic/teichoic acid biosynthesis glycosyltransferase
LYQSAEAFFALLRIPYQRLQIKPWPMISNFVNESQFFPNQALAENLPWKVVKRLEQLIDWEETGAPAVLGAFPGRNDRLKGSNSYQLDISEGSGCVIYPKQINDVRYINKFFECVNERLRPRGYFIGWAETSSYRRRRQRESLIWPFNVINSGLDYLFNRLWPKLPHLKRVYFAFTKGYNRILSEMEVFGRLYSCGYEIVDDLIVDGRLYFIAQKVKAPDYNPNPTYGPIIRLRRAGKNGKTITVYKLRTMSPYSEYLQAFILERYGLEEGGKFCDDPRVNLVGQFCRKYWIDELPMLINFLKGDMKLFGVRPISMQYLNLYPPEFRAYRQRFKPGLIPPLVVEIPKSFEDIIAIERRYLEAYERNPIATDLRYCYRAIYNILFKKVRSK